MSIQQLEQFKLRLAQTISWCAPRADKNNPATSLRTAYLRPRMLEENRFTALDTVSHARELLGGADVINAVIPRDLGGGRLLVYFPDSDLACGAAEYETGGFFDINNVPPWDTWVAYFQDEERSIDSFDTDYLVAWIPPEFVELADGGIGVNPEECIKWLSDTSVELARVLRAAKLLV